MQDKDKFLIERFQQGDNKAFDELVRKYQNKIYQLAYNFTHNVEDALDLSQEIFLRAFKSLEGFKQQSNFYTWLYRIAQNLGIDYTRSKKRCLKTVSLTEYMSSEKYYETKSAVNAVNRKTKSSVSEANILSNVAFASPSNLVEAKELESKITNAIDMLPPRQKSAFILRYYEDLDLNNIAEILGCKVGTVKAHLSYARDALKKKLSPYLLDGISS